MNYEDRIKIMSYEQAKDVYKFLTGADIGAVNNRIDEIYRSATEHKVCYLLAGGSHGEI